MLNNFLRLSIASTILISIMACSTSPVDPSSPVSSTSSEDRAPASETIGTSEMPMQLAMIGSRSVPPQEYEHIAVWRIAGRAQRVRYFLADAEAVRRFWWFGSQSSTHSEGFNHLVNDPIRSNQVGSVFNFFAAGNSSTAVGYSEIGGNSNSWSSIVSPHLVVCATDMLKLVTQSSDKYRDVFERYKIDEINIFIKPVARVVDLREEDSRLDIAKVAARPRDPALNVRIPFVIENHRCMLPTVTVFERALEHASGMPKDKAQAPAVEVGLLTR
jgi:hypothetical protein